jgi:hypothetical protein
MTLLRLRTSFLLICLITIIRCESSYAQIDVDKAVDDLLAKTFSQIKTLSANRGIRDIAVWKIEVDEKGLVNVRELADRMNIALIKEGILRELAMDFTDVADRGALKRLAAIYGITAFIYGKGTTVEGNNVRVAFQVFDVESDETIWENTVVGVSGPAEAVPTVVGGMTVASTPDKAKVFLDGRYKGDTPLTLSDLAVGRYILSIEKEGYRVWEKEIVVREGITTSVEAALDPIAPPAVKPTPDKARAFLEEKYTQYLIDAKLDTIRHTISGIEKVEYFNRAAIPLKEVYFVLRANLGREKNPHIDDINNDIGYPDGFDPTWTEVSSVKDSSGSLLPFTYEKAPPIYKTYSLDKGLLRVDLPRSLSPGESVILDIEFETKLAHSKLGDNFYDRDTYNPIERAIVGDKWDSEGDRIVAGLYEVKLTVPGNMIVVSGGDYQTEVDNKDGTKAVHITNDVPRRSVPLTISSRFRVEEAEAEGILIYSYYFPGHEAGGSLVASYAKDILKHHIKHYGPYRYKRLVITENINPGAGITADGFVTIEASFYKFLNRSLDLFLAREIGHQWWSISIGADLDAESWLSEAFAQYTAMSYYERKYGSKGDNFFEEGTFEALFKYFSGDINMREQLEALYLTTLRDGRDEALIKPMKDVEYGNVVENRIYSKGYLIVRALEGVIGQDTFERILREVYERYKGQLLSIKEFQAICEEISGKDLDQFFDQWLYKSEFIDYSVKSVESTRMGEGYQTAVRIGKAGKAINPVDVEAITERGERVVECYSGDKEEGIVIFNSKERVSSVHVDPDSMVPDVYRLNNNNSPKVKFYFGLNDNPTDAYSIRYYQ